MKILLIGHQEGCCEEGAKANSMGFVNPTLESTYICFRDAALTKLWRKNLIMTVKAECCMFFSSHDSARNSAVCKQQNIVRD